MKHILILILATAPAGDAPTGPTEEVEEITDIESLDEPAYQPPAPTLSQTISRMHAALVHLPIGALMMVLFLELVALVGRREQLRVAAWLVLAATTAAFLPALVTGWMHLSGMGESPRLERAVDHRNLMILAFILLLAALPLGRAGSAGPRLWLYRGLVLAAATVVTVGGHFGGKLVFGEHYLPF